MLKRWDNRPRVLHPDTRATGYREAV